MEVIPPAAPAAAAAPAPAPAAAAPAVITIPPAAPTIVIPQPAAPAANAPAPAPAPAAATQAAPPAGAEDTKALWDRLAKLEEQNQTNLRARIAAESGIPSDAVTFLTASDEAGMRAQAAGLKALIPAGTPASPPPPAAGTASAPPAAQVPTLDERIAAAEKGTNKYESIRLKLERLTA